MTIDHPRPNGLRGRVRPGPRWQRFDADVLRLSRLVADLDAEASRWPETSPVRIVVSSCARAVRDVGEAITPESESTP